MLTRLGTGTILLRLGRHKLLKFWPQSFLAKVPTIVVGFRDDNGFLRGVQSYETLALPRLVRGKPGMWVRTDFCM